MMKRFCVQVPERSVPYFLAQLQSVLPMGGAILDDSQTGEEVGDGDDEEAEEKRPEPEKKSKFPRKR